MPRVVWSAVRALQRAGGRACALLSGGCHFDGRSRRRVATSKLPKLVDGMLALHKSLSGAKTAHEKEALQRQIDATDRQIDRLVYELYGLTDDEIRIVEEAT